eukprot:gene42064-51353_t
MSNSDMAAEVVKVASFLDYVQKNAPGVGAAAGFTSRMTEALKDQVESGGASFVGLMEQVKDHAPAVAAAGYSYASGFAETIVKMAPGVLNGIKDVSGDVLDFLKATAPDAFSTAQQVAEQVGAFVMEQGPAVLDGISSVGGSVIGALGDKIPGLLQGAGDGASAAKDGAGAAATVASNVDSSDLSQAVQAVQGVAGSA